MPSIVPAEWAPHRALWLGFPSHADLWQSNLGPARDEVAALARALATVGGEHVRLFVHGREALADARARLGHVPGVELVPGRFGDIWLRDTGPLFTDGGKKAVSFRFNGWGGKYELEHDDTVARQLADLSASLLKSHDFVIEGGALDHDGFGTVLTTRQCLLNANRNTHKDLPWTEAIAESALRKSVGASRVLWLGDGLLNDHTDGHVDNLARFIAPGVVCCQQGTGDDDPNTAAYDAVAEALAGALDARGEPIRVVRIPSPGLQHGADGEIVPASHMNFLIANKAVIVPTYGDDAVVDALRPHFPHHVVLGLPSRAILTGGGSFHCISQQVPA
jgi:agmatine deiminase